VTDEVRTVSATGGEKGVKRARFDLIPAGPLWQLAELFGKGAEKYEDRNWERGYEWSKSYGALMRHVNLWWQGRDLDEHEPDCAEDCTQHTVMPHLASVAWHALALLEFAATHPEFDDRPATMQARETLRAEMRAALNTGLHTIEVIDGATGERKEITVMDYPNQRG
jgi:hypothetical protein